MFKTIKKIVTNENLWKRIVFTFSILLIFRIGHYVKIPFVEINNVSSGSTGFASILNMASTFTGGNFSKACLFSLGVSPYISMSLVMTVLKMMAKISDGQLPGTATLKKWDDEGTYGRIKYERLTRTCATVMSFVFAFVFLKFVPLKDDLMITKVLFVLLMVAGTTICIWLGDLITEKGIGNGISVLMFAGIVARIPTEFLSAYYAIQAEWESTSVIYAAFAVYVVVYLLFVIFICGAETTTRKINIQTTMKSKNNKKRTFPLSLKINFSGVMPIILVSSLFAIVGIICGNLSEKSMWFKILSKVSYDNWYGIVIYILFTFLFSYIYSRISFNSEEQAKHLKNNNQVIVGVRPGKDTEAYFSRTIRNLSMIGGFTLVIIAALPIMLPLIWDNQVARSVALGGTGLMIVVSVAIESIKQIDSQLKEIHGFMDVETK